MPGCLNSVKRLVRPWLGPLVIMVILLSLLSGCSNLKEIEANTRAFLGEVEPDSEDCILLTLSAADRRELADVVGAIETVLAERCEVACAAADMTCTFELDPGLCEWLLPPEWFEQTGATPDSALSIWLGQPEEETDSVMPTGGYGTCDGVDAMEAGGCGAPGDPGLQIIYRSRQAAIGYQCAGPEPESALEDLEPQAVEAEGTEL